MGGGDLNSKKSWHPNTMKNQERVWKAEKAAAEEKKKIAELQQERNQEKDRADLNALAKQNYGSSSDNHLNWMYNKPDTKVKDEEYLLGKSIDSNYDRTEKSEQDAIPAVSRRVVGSSMLAAAGDTQVDLARKLREDPLLLVKERERAARAALLNNPLQRKRLTELLRKEQEHRKEKKAKSKKKTDLDDKLAAKLNALSGQKGIDLATLLASDDSSSVSSTEEDKPKKKKKTKKNKKKSKRTLSDIDSCSDNESIKKRHKKSVTEKDRKFEKSKYKSSKDDTSDEKEKYDERRYKNSTSDRSSCNNKYRESDPRDERRDPPDCSSATIKYRDKSRERNDYNNSYDKNRERENHRRVTSEDPRPSYERKRAGYSSPSEGRRGRGKGNQVRLSSAERAARLAEMSAAGAQHESARARRVAGQRAADAEREDCSRARPPRTAPAHALPSSLETRIHSNRHNIQRNERHMNENFARR